MATVAQEKKTVQEERVSNAIVSPYKDQDYQKTKGNVLGIIGKSNFLSAIRNNAWMINGTLATIVITGIVTGATALTMPLIVGLVSTTLVLAGFSAYAAYVDEKMSKEASYNYEEEKTIASTRIAAAANIEIAKENAHALPGALHETLGAELQDARNENCKTQSALVETQHALVQTTAAVAHLQKQILNWQEREVAKEPVQTQLVK